MSFDRLPAVAQRFIRYARVHTTSDPNSKTFPSTERQKELSRLLADELRQMGVPEVHLSEEGYVYATIPGNQAQDCPRIAFCSHVDTAPDCSGEGVKPLVHFDYQGQPIVLPKNPAQIITREQHPYLNSQLGNTLITASGDTLLGADDKAGVAIIMTLMEELLANPQLPHGEVKAVFTPDEEVGRGTEKIDLKFLNADYGYTLDGGEVGTLEDETFSANGLTLTVQGVITHPGTAKNKLVNALKVLGQILATLPRELSPEGTEGRQGFVHPVAVQGIAEEASAQFIIRDFDTAQLAVHEQRLRLHAEAVAQRHPGSSVSLESHEQYRNMKEVLDQHPQVIALAEQAYQLHGLEVRKEPIRGGTDGSRLSFLGLPTANLFTGMQGIHSLQEWVSVQDMQKAVDVLKTLVGLWAKQAATQHLASSNQG